MGKLYEKADTIKLPNNLIVYNPFNRSVLDSNQIANSTFKIYSFIDVSCPSCLTNLQNWNKVASELSKYKVPIILVCQSEDNFELIKYLCEKKDIPEFPFPFYFDDQKQFFMGV
ncbi:MAG TPA: hypothetical protein DDY89_11640 [Lysinibacillus sp.]|nr:hypothetical protein [Lysinibacillus sp.]